MRIFQRFDYYLHEVARAHDYSPSNLPSGTIHNRCHTGQCYRRWWLGCRSSRNHTSASTCWLITSLWCALRAASWRGRCSNCYLTSQCIYWFNCCGKWLCSRFSSFNYRRNFGWCLWNYFDAAYGRGNGPFIIWNLVWCLYRKTSGYI